MKLIIALLVFSSFALAGVTPAQMKEIRKSAVEVMYDLGADSELNARVKRVSIVDELGSRVKVKFTYVENMYGERTCTYYYDLKKMDVIPGSALCGL